MVYYIVVGWEIVKKKRNDKNDFMQFSSLNIMPHNDTIKHEFNINRWIDDPINHIESIKYSDYLKPIIKEDK